MTALAVDGSVVRYYNKDKACQAVQPGGYCPGMVPNGNGTCTWNYEEAGVVTDAAASDCCHNCFLNQKTQ